MEVAELTSRPSDLSPERPIRVLCVDYSIGFGGATKSMALMLRDIPAIEPVIVTSQEPELRRLWYGKWPTHSFRRLINYRTRRRVDEWMNRVNAPGVVRGIISKGVALLDALTGIGNDLRFAWLIKRYRIDLVHLTNGFVPLEALFAARLTGVPSIAHLRGFFRGEGVRRARSAKWFEPSLVIGDSVSVTESYLQSSGLRAPATTIHEVVDVPRFDASAHLRDEGRAAWQIADDDVAVALFGRVMAWKGQKEFVLAMVAAMEHDPTLVAVLVGDGSDGPATYFDEVKALIQQSGKADRFRLTGYIEDVEPLYSAMDVVVHASIEPEPCGMVVMEAMAARRPVIAADAGGPRELVRENVDGHLVTPGDVAALTNAILDLAQDADRRTMMGECGYRRARELFDVPIAAARLRTIYERLIDGDRVATGEWLPDWVSVTTSS